MAPPQSLGEGEELVAGRRPVEEAFVARRPARRLLVVPQRRAALEKLVLHATNLRIPIVEVEGGSLTALAGFDGHQGIALVVEPRRYAGLDDILARAATRGEPPFVLVLDSLEDPHNVGSLLRSAEAAGVHGVIFPTHRQAPLSPSAIKASAGAVEHLLLCPVDDLAGALSDLHVRGVRIAGAEGDAPMTARESDLRGPLAIVVGSEGQGLGPAVRRRCDMFMRIPMRGAVGSLNAAVAGSILLFEAVAQRDMERADGSPPAPTEAPAKAKPKRATKATAAVAPPAPTEAPAKAKPKRATKATAAVAPPAPAEAPAKAPAAPKPKPKPKRATKATATVAQPAAAEAPAKAKPRRIAKTTASAAPAAPVKPKRAARPKPAANDVPTAPDDGESDLLPD
jgi:23S rRNA (guanosine2251-2'-O)-methyltransferase